ncbi:CHAP domain-containing protein [Microbacterium mangrovi]|uniref:CHAP domain-containing protein n=1 Tax=Microbacterium mangrovi TaxID=1348253 RepID=UPI0006924A51|nr:CHAP domain-containing protein [Microbacterium mangrovi]
MSALAVIAIVLGGTVAQSLSAQALTWYGTMCKGFTACTAAGYGNAGYAAVYTQSFWYMYSGHNCTNYASYRLQKRGIADFISAGHGNATDWGSQAQAKGITVDRTPAPGDIAWWTSAAIAPLGHVAYVESVNAAAGTFVVSEDNSSLDFDWRTYRISEVSGFIQTSTMGAVVGVPQGGTTSPAATVRSATPRITGSAVVGQTVAVKDGAWSPAPVTLKHQWYRNGQSIAGETGTTHRVVAGDAGQKLTVVTTGSRTGYTSATALSPAVVPVKMLTASPSPVISGDVTPGSTITAKPGAWAPAPVTLAYQWSRNGAAIAGATSASYKVLATDLGASLTVRVTGSKAGYGTVARLSAAAVVSPPFTAAPTPTVSGTPVAGAKLTATTGAWAPAPDSLTYQWYRSGAAIPGATASAYTVAVADRGTALTVVVTGRRSGYATTTRTSAPIAVPRLLTATPVPVVSGIRAAGALLTAQPGAWTPAPVTLSYQWLRNGIPVAGATASSYRPPVSDVGASITVRVTGSKSGYLTVAKTSAAVVLLKPLTATPVPQVTGSVTAGSVLTAQPGTWGPAPVALSYQWYRDGAAIAGMTAATYQVVVADRGSTLTVKVTGSRAGFATVTETSAGRAVPRVLTATPTPQVTGIPTIGSTFTARPGTWAPAPLTLTYQWYRGATPIPGATSATYRAAAADFGASITVRVTGSKPGYLTVTKASAGVVVLKALTATPVPQISGSLTAGSVLSAQPGAWGPAPVTFTYQWLRNGAAIGGATATTYRVTPLDRGTTLSVRVTGAKSGYLSVTRLSAGHAVPRVLTSTPTPVIAGSPAIGSALTALPGTWAPAPVTLTYQWLRNGVPIAGATGATYRSTLSDLGASVFVRVTASKAGYLTVTRTSAGVVVLRPLTATPAPQVTGSLTAGSVLTAQPGAWGPAPVTLAYQWFRSGVAIPGATGRTYTVAVADRGTVLTVGVTGSKPGYLTVVTTSAGLSVPRVLTATPVPTIAGTPAIGATLTAQPGTWGPAPVALTYQWLRDGVPIAGATSATYGSSSGDLGASIAVRITATKAGYLTVTQTSPAVVMKLPLTATPVPQISGTPTAGSVLTARPGAWAPAPVALTYQWYRSGTPIAGATRATYTVTVADRGTTLAVKVTGAAPGYATVTQTSAGLAVPRVLTATPTPVIAGTAVVGATLTAQAGAWGPAPVALRYQWLRNGVPIAGATTSAYKVATVDRGTTIAVRVTGGKAGYLSVTKTSAGKSIPR